MFLQNDFNTYQLYGDITPQNIFPMALFLIIINKIILFSQNTSKKVQHKRAIQIRTMKKRNNEKRNNNSNMTSCLSYMRYTSMAQMFN